MLSLMCRLEAEELKPTMRDQRALKVELLPPSPSNVKRFGRVEFPLRLEATYGNPFDPDEIAVDGTITQPTGRAMKVPAFFWAGYHRELRERSEVLTATGEAGWRLRFCPTEVGPYKVAVTAKDRSGSAQSNTVSFNCVASNSPGFVRVSRDDRHYFAFDSGKPFVPIGANLCWAGSRGTFDYDDWLSRYGEAGCNYFRVWLAPGWGTFGFERTGEGCGVGRYDLAKCWRLDAVLDLAEQRGLYVMLCINSFNELRYQKDGCYPFWENTPYTKANGGPLQEPREWWTNAEMKRLYRNRLRYLVARYGARTNVMAWEFWNEVDIISPSAWNDDEVKQWHAEMGDYLRSVDPYHHLLTTSFADSKGRTFIDTLPQMDYCQTHSYGPRDMAAAHRHFQELKGAYGKPHYVGEFGTDAGGGEQKVDPSGLCLHNGIWASLLSGAAGSGMLWWWDNHIHPNNLYYHFTALSRFIAGVDFPQEQFGRVEGCQLTYQDPRQPASLEDLVFADGPVSWNASEANRPTTVTASRDGKVTKTNAIAGILHGLRNHPDLHNPVTFQLDLPRPTRFLFRLGGVSGWGGAHLVVKLDNDVAVDKDLPDTSPEGKHDTLMQYAGEVPITIPEGSHTLLVENTGKDWVFVSYVFKDLVTRTEPLLRVFGLRGRTTILVWVQQPDHEWYPVCVMKTAPRPSPPTWLEIPGLKPGRYQVTTWDTYKGAPIATAELPAKEGVLKIPLPAIESDVAVKIRMRK